MEIVIVGSEIECENVLVGYKQYTVLLKAISVILGDIARIEQLFVVFESLTHVERALVDAERVESRDRVHLFNMSFYLLLFNI